MAMNFKELLGLLAVGILIIALAPTATKFLGAVTGGEEGGQAATTTKVEITNPDKACGSTTMTMDFAEKYSSSTSLTSQNGTVYIDGKEKGIFNEGSTFTANGGNTLNIYYTLDPAQTTYYAAHASGKIPCTGQTASFLTSEILKKGELAGALQEPVDEVYRADTAITKTIMNDDSTQNIGSSGTGKNQSVGTGQTKTLEVKVYPTFERGLGVADGNTLACQLNDTAWDQAQSIISLNGINLPDAKYVPSNTLFPLVDTSRTAKYWAVPAIDGKVSSELRFIFRVKGDDTNQPSNGGQGGTTNGADWNCTIFDTDLYTTDDGKIKVDIEDRDDNTNTGVSNDFSFNIGFN